MSHWAFDLTPIEWNLLRALAASAGNKEIAREQCKNEHTVRNQLAILFEKIDVNNRAQAVNWYHEYLDVKETALIGISVQLVAEVEVRKIGAP